MMYNYTSYQHSIVLQIHNSEVVCVVTRQKRPAFAKPEEDPLHTYQLPVSESAAQEQRGSQTDGRGSLPLFLRVDRESQARSSPVGTGLAWRYYMPHTPTRAISLAYHRFARSDRE